MKFKITLLFLFLGAALTAQITERIIENTYDLPASKKVILDFKFAKMVTVKTWDRNALGLKTILRRSDESMDDIHQMTVRESGSSLRINTTYDTDEDRWGEYRCWDCDEGRSEACMCFSVSYEILLPADADLELETISGDFEIRGLEGPVRAKSISGFVDFGLHRDANADLRFSSVTGEIYTDFEILSLDNSSTPYSKRLTSTLNGGGPLISLETVSGDIFFRKE